MSYDRSTYLEAHYEITKAWVSITAMHLALGQIDEAYVATKKCIEELELIKPGEVSFQLRAYGRTVEEIQEQLAQCKTYRDILEQRLAKLMAEKTAG